MACNPPCYLPCHLLLTAPHAWRQLSSFFSLQWQLAGLEAGLPTRSINLLIILNAKMTPVVWESTAAISALLARRGELFWRIWNHIYHWSTMGVHLQLLGVQSKPIRGMSVSLVGMLSCYLPRFQKNDGSSPMWFNFLNCSPANPGWETESKEPLRFHPAWKSDDCNLADNYLLLASRYIYWCCTRTLPQLGANKSRGSFSAFGPSFGNFN